MFGFGPLASFSLGAIPAPLPLLARDPLLPIIVIENDSPTHGVTAVSICSNALILLGDKPIASFDEETDRAATMANVYPMERDAMLRDHPWNCATKRVVLSPDATQPAFGYRNRFRVPADCVRVRAVTDSWSCDVDDYQLESGYLLSDQGVLYLRYGWANTIESTWDDLLVRAMTLAMAARVCYKITASTTLFQGLTQELALVLKKARSVDAQENPADTLRGSSLLDARYGYGRRVRW